MTGGWLMVNIHQNGELGAYDWFIHVINHPWLGMVRLYHLYKWWNWMNLRFIIVKWWNWGWFMALFYPHYWGFTTEHGILWWFRDHIGDFLGFWASWWGWFKVGEYSLESDLCSDRKGAYHRGGYEWASFTNGGSWVPSEEMFASRSSASVFFRRGLRTNNINW